MAPLVPLIQRWALFFTRLDHAAEGVDGLQGRAAKGQVRQSLIGVHGVDVVRGVHADRLSQAMVGDGAGDAEKLQHAAEGDLIGGLDPDLHMAAGQGVVLGLHLDLRGGGGRGQAAGLQAPAGVLLPPVGVTLFNLAEAVVAQEGLAADLALVDVAHDGVRVGIGVGLGDPGGGIVGDVADRPLLVEEEAEAQQADQHHDGGQQGQHPLYHHHAVLPAEKLFHSISPSQKTRCKSW